VSARRAFALCGTTALVAGLLAGCNDGEPDPPGATIIPTQLSFSAYGAPQELAAYGRIVDAWNLDNPGAQVTLTTTSDRADQADQLRSSAGVPDVFLVDRRDLGYLRENDLTHPVGELFDQPGRDIDFGDDYPIDSVQAFAHDSDLECLPYAYSPMVIYYNTDLVDFDKMKRRGLDVPTTGNAWTFEEFAAAVKFASRPATHAAGVYVEPTLRGLAPFIYSGGGKLYDDPTTPTSLAFSDGDTKSALSTTLELLRNPLFTLSDNQLKKHTALEWFERGRLGMIPGFRSLIPKLRQTKGLHFDVLAMPAINDAKTVGEVTGLCMSKSVQDPEAAADFMYYLSSAKQVSAVAQAGYLVPANLEVTADAAFLQPDQQPASAMVFTNSLRSIVLPPVIDDEAALQAAVGADVRRLFSMGVLDLDVVTERIDTDSQKVLAPETASPSASPSD